MSFDNPRSYMLETVFLGVGFHENRTMQLGTSNVNTNFAHQPDVFYPIDVNSEEFFFLGGGGGGHVYLSPSEPVKNRF